MAGFATSCSRSEPERAPAPPPAHRTAPPAPQAASRPIPPFHESAEAARPLPRILPAEYFRGYPIVQQAYRIAGRIPEVIAQQPCFCYCDKFGHRSLLDCFASDHGAG
ncbi:MAG: hypothetical protein HYY26_05745 [Acidobacteria bacterium]|nr:hypothetical protein [Acidobacteriota bacterium]